MICFIGQMLKIYLKNYDKMNIEKIYEKYDGLCAYCGQRITINDMKVENYGEDKQEEGH